MRAYVIGNATIDESFALPALPSPGESIKAKAVDRCLGGKGANQAVILSRCGVDTIFITATADDPRGKEIRQLLHDEPLTAHFVHSDTAVSDQSILLSRPDGENAVISTTACAEQLRTSAIAPLLESTQPEDSLILQGNLQFQTTQELLELAKEIGLTTVFNPSPVHAEFVNLWHLVDALFLNETEALTLTGKNGTAAAHHLLQQGIETVILTQGATGAWFATNDAITHIPASLAQAIDTSGAGDTFMSVVIASAQLRGTAIDALAIQHGHKAAAITVSRYGTVSAFPTDTELAAVLQKNG